MARPSAFTPELAAAICERMAAGESLRSICRSVGMPPESTVRLWAREDRDGFMALYARARELQAHTLADEILEIADDAHNAESAEQLQASRLRIDARKWYTSKVMPKIYGDKIETEVYGKDGAPLIPTLSVTVRRE